MFLRPCKKLVDVQYCICTLNSIEIQVKRNFLIIKTNDLVYESVFAS